MTDAMTLRKRLLSIDALRGLVIVLMLLDHVRETFLLHRQVADPMSIDSTEPALFVSRTLAHLCAPVFVLLTGLSAYLYGEKYQGKRDVSAFLFKRGLFLVVLEFTLVNFAWTFQFPPSVIYLQVIWAIGISMIALSALVWLPRPALFVVGLVIVAGHTLLDTVHFAVGSDLHVPWAILHDRGWIEFSDTLRLRTSSCAAVDRCHRARVLRRPVVYTLGFSPRPSALLVVDGYRSTAGFCRVTLAQRLRRGAMDELRECHPHADELFQHHQIPAFAAVSHLDPGRRPAAVARL